MFLKYTEKRLPAITAALMLLLMISGCASFPNATDDTPDLSSRFDPSAERCVVDIKPAHGKPTRWEGPLSKGMTVQAALEASGAFQKVRKMNVVLVRAVPENGTILRLVVDMQPNQKGVVYEQDYALLPGDRILVSPAVVENPLEKFIGNLM